MDDNGDEASFTSGHHSIKRTLLRPSFKHIVFTGISVLLDRLIVAYPVKKFSRLLKPECSLPGSIKLSLRRPGKYIIGEWSSRSSRF